MRWLEDMWWHEEAGAHPALLAPLAAAECIYRAGSAARAALYRSGLVHQLRAAAPVISIGNLAVGGAGKTPVTIEIAGRLRTLGRRVAVLSRGYGARRSDARVVSDGENVLLPVTDAGDEPLLIARRLPGVAVLCGPRRVELARRAVADLGADAIVLDDGFQHRALLRDLDVVVVDASNPSGNGRLLPRGPNREPWSAVGRAHLAWLSRTDQATPGVLGAVRARLLEATGKPPIESRYAVEDVLDAQLGRSYGAGALDGRRVLLVCGLARPEGFRRTLAALGAEVVEERVFRDHHAFSEEEIEEALRAAGAVGCDALATTEKDAVRIPPRLAGDLRWRVVRICSHIVAGESLLDEHLERALGSGGRASVRR
jgi:tetraacyldisaccharide 4'-kinase